MKFEMKLKLIPAIIILALTLLGMACEPKSGAGSGDATPTGAYKKLYEAVKGKNVEATKAVMSKQTLAFAQSVAQRQNIALDKVFENGFTATTFSPSLPEIRDERIKDGFGAIEVYNSKDKRWEDLPFVLEDGVWKLAVGDLFANTFKSPGKGRTVLEMEAANAAGNNNMIIVNTNQAGNFTSAPRPNKKEETNSAANAPANSTANSAVNAPAK